MRRSVIGLSLCAAALLAQDTRTQPEGSQFPGPGEASAGLSWMSGMLQWKRDPADSFESWIKDLRTWRHERLIRMGYDDSEYRRPELRWAQRNFVQPQMMAEERFFYDPVERRYTVIRYLDDLVARYGGIDSVLIWPVYPNIGIDNRNQWDLARDMPGGVAGLRAMIADFHRRGVRVFFPAMPWDNGTRDPGMPYWEATTKLMAEIGADGVNGDTFGGVPLAYQKAAVAAGHPLVFEPEGAPQSDEMLAWNVQSWGYWSYPFVPMASKLKWLEPRHMINVCNRWARDHTNDLQFAFFNGVGFESWENIWGIWNQMTPRDAEALRRVATLERAMAELLVSPDWVPHQPSLRYGVYASLFPGKGRALWTVVNRNEYDIAGPQLRVEHVSGRRYYDLWNGVELKPHEAGGWAELDFPMEGQGFGAILAVDAGASVDGLDALLNQGRKWSVVPLKSLSQEWQVLKQKMIEIPATKLASSAPAGMIRVPGGDYLFASNGIELEGANWTGLDVQYPWEETPRRVHRHRIVVKSFFIDRFPVTNAEFKRFLDATHYRSADDHNFLRDWTNGTYPAGWGNKPVTWVSIEDVRVYAAWAGKRLPHEWEWQYAAQGADGRTYPWGKEWDPAAMPAPHKGRDLNPPDDVDAHPKGASPLGVMDLVGNVWQWTDEYVDDHTRAAVLKGGSHYQPQGSIWYFPQAYKLGEHGKYLLLAPSKDRAGTLGFRCVMDAD